MTQLATEKQQERRQRTDLGQQSHQEGVVKMETFYELHELKCTVCPAVLQRWYPKALALVLDQGRPKQTWFWFLQKRSASRGLGGATVVTWRSTLDVQSSLRVGTITVSFHLICVQLMSECNTCRALNNQKNSPCGESMSHPGLNNNQYSLQICGFIAQLNINWLRQSNGIVIL